MVVLICSETENSSEWQDHGRWQYTPCRLCHEWCIDIGASPVQIGSTSRLLMESCSLQFEGFVVRTFSCLFKISSLICTCEIESELCISTFLQLRSHVMVKLSIHTISMCHRKFSIPSFTSLFPHA